MTEAPAVHLAEALDPVDQVERVALDPWVGKQIGEVTQALGERQGRPHVVVEDLGAPVDQPQRRRGPGGELRRRRGWAAAGVDCEPP